MKRIYGLLFVVALTLGASCVIPVRVVKDEAPAPSHKMGAIQQPGAPGVPVQVFGATGSTATGVVSGAGTYRSDWIDLSIYVGGASFDCAWSGGSGSPAGSWTLEGSNATSPPDINTAGLSLPLANTPTAISGNSGASGIDAPLTGFRFVRAVATVSSGSFTLTCNCYIKRIN